MINFFTRARNTVIGNYMPSLERTNHRNMSAEASRDIDFNQLTEFIDKKNIYLIDVREKQELLDTGTYPGGVNVPLGEIGDALKLSEEDFQKKYGAPKPSRDTKIVFACRAGARSLKALTEAVSQGYDNSLNYAGGWLDWEKQIQNTK